jgi:Rrf2 family nitric oxide-sensitive transcriptional repressor
MRLTDHTDYSLRVLMYLNQKKKLATLNELSEILNISKNNLIKVSHQLARFELIETTKGRAGGLRIKENTGTLSLKEIILHTEESLTMASCFTGRTDCTLLRGCKLKHALNDALTAFLDSLEETTLNEITP